MISTTTKATQKNTKLHNKRLVLKTIYDQGQISRANTARATHLARTTVSNLVSELISEGLVEEVGRQVLDRGKPATLLSVIKNSRHLISVDLSDREFRGAIIDLRGNIIHRQSASREESKGEAALELVYQLIDDLITLASSSLLGIGVGISGMVDIQKGHVLHSGHFDWKDVPIRELLSTRYDLPVYIANDSDVAALGEYTFGNGRDASKLVALMVGMGVSIGITLNGQIYSGNDFGAGEIGHITVVKNGEPCVCGNTGCLETVVSESVLIKRARTIARHNAQSKLHQYAPNPDDITNIEIVLHAFQAGDQELRALIDEMGRYLGYAIANISSILNIKHVFIYGSIAQFGEPLLEAVRDELNHCLHPILAAHTQIEFSGLGQDIVMQGAGALVLSGEMGLV